MAKEQKKRRNALGKGLSALLQDSDTPSLETKDYQIPGNVSEIPISSIETNPYQPRTHFDLVALEELSESIKVQGIIQPITVRKLNDTSYQLISGERRLQASKLAGLETIPAYIRTANDEQMLEMALIENIQREDLNPIEISLAYKRMIEELSLKQEDLGDKVGKKRATVTNYLRLLKLPPEIQIGLRDQKIGMGHAKALLGVENADQQLALFHEIIDQELSVRKIEELARNLQGKKKQKSRSSESGKSIFLKKIEGDLEEKFGNRVVLSQKQTGKGEIKIDFDSTEDLNRILEILNG